MNKQIINHCYVRVENKEERAQLSDWLKSQGIRVCPCALFEGNNTINCSTIERNGVAKIEAHGTPDNYPEAGFSIGQFRATTDSIDMHTSVDAFKYYILNYVTKNK